MELLYFLGIFAAGQGLFQAFLIASGLKQGSIDQVLLGLILVFLSISVFEYTMVWSGNIAICPHLMGFSSIAQFLFCPLIYFFFLIGKGEKIVYPFVHFIPFLFIFCCFTEILFLGASDKLPQIGSIYNYTISIGVLNIPLCILFVSQCLVYFFLVRLIKDIDYNILSKTLYRIFVFYLAVHIIHTSLITFMPMSLANMGLGILVTSIVAIYILSYYTYQRGQIIIEEKVPKYFHSNLSKNRAQEILSNLETLLKKENYFTNPAIRISTIAPVLNVSTQHLSQSINQELGCSFRDYLNGMRIDYAQSLIKKEQENRISLKEVAYDSGFNNKTSFANAFKKKNKMTPSQYVAILKGTI